MLCVISQQIQQDKLRKSSYGRTGLSGNHYNAGQSRTGGVLGAVPSAAVMGARGIFPGGGANSGMQKS